MTTRTITLTETPPTQYPTLVLRAGGPSAERARTLDTVIEDLLSLEVFTDEQRDQIRELLSTYERLGDYKQRATALCFLIFKFIDPAIKSNEDVEQVRQQLLNLESEVENILKEYIPDGMDIEDFLDAKSEEQIVIDQLAIMENDLQELINFAASAANTINQERIDRVESLEGRIAALCQENILTSSQLTLRTNAIARKIDAVKNKMQTFISSKKDSDTRLRREQKTLHQIVKK